MCPAQAGPASCVLISACCHVKVEPAPHGALRRGAETFSIDVCLKAVAHISAWIHTQGDGLSAHVSLKHMEYLIIKLLVGFITAWAERGLLSSQCHRAA